jgi:hypothetical protein
MKSGNESDNEIKSDSDTKSDLDDETKSDSDDETKSDSDDETKNDSDDETKSGSDNSQSKKQTSKDEKKLEIAPRILELEDNEKFKDSDGDIMDIEVRGERDHKNCYFKLIDVMNKFDISSLDTTVQHNGGYKRGIHFKTFIFTPMSAQHRSKNESRKNKSSKPVTFLTYKGLLRAIVNSDSKNADNYQDWAMEYIVIVY